MQPSLKIGRIAGIEIGLHYTWLLIAALIGASFVGYFSELNPQWPARVSWSAAVVISVLFFGSILLHELAHALVARAYDMPVRTITLFALGGVAHIEKEAASPSAEFWMGVAGPVMSGLLGGLCAGIASWMDHSPAVPAVAVLLALSSLNFMLAVFNLIPGFPLDGGRILRAVLWRIGGDEDRATRVSARVGQGIALALFGLGVWEFLALENISGLWLGLLGWFLLDAATASHQQAGVLTGLREIRVGEVMSQECAVVPADLSLQLLADDYLLKTGGRCYAVEDRGAIVGLVTPSDLAATDRTGWRETPIRQVMHPLHQLQSVSPDTPVVEALRAMGKADVNQLPVMASGRMEGLVSRSQIMQVLRTRAELSM